MGLSSVILIKEEIFLPLRRVKVKENGQNVWKCRKEGSQENHLNLYNKIKYSLQRTNRYRWGWEPMQKGRSL